MNLKLPFNLQLIFFIIRRKYDLNKNDKFQLKKQFPSYFFIPKLFTLYSHMPT